MTNCSTCTCIGIPSKTATRKAPLTCLLQIHPKMLKFFLQHKSDLYISTKTDNNILKENHNYSKLGPQQLWDEKQKKTGFHPKYKIHHKYKTCCEIEHVTFAHWVLYPSNPLKSNWMCCLPTIPDAAGIIANITIRDGRQKQSINSSTQQVFTSHYILKHQSKDCHWSRTLLTLPPHSPPPKKKDTK